MIPKWTQICVLFACLVGFVVLAVRGQDTSSYVTFVSPVVAAVFLAQRLDQRTDAQDEVLAKISHQTNGVLTERIENAVTAALEKQANGTAAPAPSADVPANWD